MVCMAIPSVRARHSGGYLCAAPKRTKKEPTKTPAYSANGRRKPARCHRTRVSGRTIVMALRIDGNHRYSWMKNKRSLFTRPLLPQHDCATTIEPNDVERVLTDI